MRPDKAYTVTYGNVTCARCHEPMPKGTPLTAWRKQPYHPGCFEQAREEAFTPPPF